jgi:hypothetical protein
MFCQLNFEFDNVKLLYAQVGVGLMIFQQLGGINGVGFYASYIFTSAGTQLCLLLFCLFLITVLLNMLIVSKLQDVLENLEPS